MKPIYIIIALLVVIMVIGLGAGAYLSMSLKAKLDASRLEVQTLKSEKAALGVKISKGLAYAEVFDIMMYGGWKSAGITPRFNFNDDKAALTALQSRVKNLGDKTLDAYEKDIEKTGSGPSVLKTMDYILGAIQTALK